MFQEDCGAYIRRPIVSLPESLIHILSIECEHILSLNEKSQSFLFHRHKRCNVRSTLCLLAFFHDGERTLGIVLRTLNLKSCLGESEPQNLTYLQVKTLCTVDLCAIILLLLKLVTS